jgi:hypothetical protein
MAAPKTVEFTETGENIRYAIEGTELVVRIDLTHRGGLSATGKTIRVATTNGNKELAPGVQVGINAYEYAVKR